MADLPHFLLPHRVRVRPYLGTGGLGESYGPLSDPIPANVQGGSQVSGGQVVQATKIYLQLQHADKFPAESEVTLPDGTVARVQACDPQSDGGLGAWEHVRVTVQ